ncbi:MAG: site-specific DNA-methyltransferase [Rhodobacteraceae bacterium]|nr:site-specific DNA-methyltransferase [Paracoccaceae bacterium]
MKTTGIYLHCDPTMSHYLKVVMDCIFGEDLFRNEIVWWYEKWTDTSRFFQRNHDIVLFYANGPAAKTFTKLYGSLTDRQVALMKTGYNLGSSGGKDIVRVYDRSKIPQSTINGWKAANRAIYDVPTPKGKAMLPSVWPIPVLNSQAKERTGYPTQKPHALLHRVVSASSNKNDMILDPFCGCATICIAAEELQCQWIGIDIGEKATELAQMRMREHLGMLYDGNHRTDIP